jgi:hypothetical protein
MDEQLIEAYESLVQADQMIIAAMIYTLANKDKQIVSMVEWINKQIDRTEK